MARYSQGWIKVPRYILNGSLGQDGLTTLVYVTLMGWANREPTLLSHEGGTVTVERGQVVTSACELACHLDFHRKTIMRRIRCLEKLGAISLQVSDFRGIIVSICNYDEIQTDGHDSSHGNDHGDGHDSDHLMEKQRSREVEKSYIPPETPQPTKAAKTAKTPKTAKAPKPPKDRIVTWTENDPLRKVFANLLAIPAYGLVFDLEHDRRVMEAHCARYNLTTAELEEITYRLSCWADGPKGKEIKSPRGTLSTFVSSFVSNKENQKPVRKEKDVPTVSEADFDW